MRRFEHILVAVLALGAISLVASAEDSGLTREEAIDRALCYMGCNSTAKATDSVKLGTQLVASFGRERSLSDTDTSRGPFLKFTFPVEISLHLSGADSLPLPGGALHVFVEAVQDDGLVWFRSVKSGYNPATYTWDTATDSDALVPPKLQFPPYTDSCPTVGFARAIQSIRTGFANDCAMLEAVCVQRTDLQGNTGAAWIVVENDCHTTAESKYPSEPKNVTRHWRTYIDAATGYWIGAGNVPMSTASASGAIGEME